MNTVKKYWMCHNAQCHANLSKTYPTLDDAVKAAKSLARHHMGNAITVLEVVDCYIAELPDAQQVIVDA